MTFTQFYEIRCSETVGIFVVTLALLTSMSEVADIVKVLEMIMMTMMIRRRREIKKEDTFWYEALYSQNSSWLSTYLKLVYGDGD